MWLLSTEGLVNYVDCGVRYYPNYFVDPTTEARSFYEGLPSAIHVTTHVFVELSLCVRFANAAACAW